MSEPASPSDSAGQSLAATAKPERTDPKLLELLVCPLTRTTLVYDEARQELISRAAGLAYPIRNGVPMMVADVARPLEDGEIERFRR